MKCEPCGSDTGSILTIKKAADALLPELFLKEFYKRSWESAKRRKYY